MKIKLPTVVALLLLLFLSTNAFAQQRRQTPPKTAKPAAAPTPAPTFDTLLPAESFTIYGEVRGVGQFIRSNTFNELLEPVLKLAGPPKEFKSLVKWLNAHADEVMTSRLLMAAWPTAKDMPDTVVAIEFTSAEEAAKFATPLKEFLPTVLPAQSPESANLPEEADKTPKPAAPQKPSVFVQRFGSLLVISPAPLDLKKLRPAGSKLLSEDPGFRAARNRFNSEPIFVFLDIKTREKEETERQKRYAEESEKQQEAAKQEAAKEAESKEPEESSSGEATVDEKSFVPEQEVTTQATASYEVTATPNPISGAFSMLASSFFGGESDWPDGVGFALSFDNDSFDLRALMVSAPGEKSDVVPFMPMLIPGAPFVPEAANIFPADTELFASMSLDLPQVYAVLSRPRRTQYYVRHGNMSKMVEEENESPFAVIEKQLKISIKDDLLPLLGSEIAVGMPVTNMDVMGLPRPPSPQPANKPAAEKEENNNAGPVLLISVKDKEAVRALIPKVIDALGLKGVSSLAQTERREDTEIVSFANLFAYAFVGNYLVLSGSPDETRHVVDSYLKHETLATESNFKSFTRWQPRPLQAELYVSPALMESYKSWANSPNTRVSDEARALLTRLTMVSQPITYSLSNEGFGPLHEVHLPKNLVLMAIAGFSGETNPPVTVRNEQMAVGTMYRLTQAEEEYKEGKGSGLYGTLEQLIDAELVSKDILENSGYKFDVLLSGDKYEISGVPSEYGKTGRLSYFIDHTRVLRGGDKNGASATSSDPPMF